MEGGTGCVSMHHVAHAEMYSVSMVANNIATDEPARKVATDTGTLRNTEIYLVVTDLVSIA